jgi:NAD-dependent dihydropyrimidine dehydrogenase PreA subunit
MRTNEAILPTILQDLCTGCGDCVATCPTGALELREGQAILARPADCAYCGDCETLCPQGAIALPFEIVFSEEPNASTDRAD